MIIVITSIKKPITYVIKKTFEQPIILIRIFLILQISLIYILMKYSQNSIIWTNILLIVSILLHFLVIYCLTLYDIDLQINNGIKICWWWGSAVADETGNCHIHKLSYSDKKGVELYLKLLNCLDFNTPDINKLSKKEYSKYQT